MSKKESLFIPALRYDWLTSLYDPIVRLTTREATFKRRLVDLAKIQTGHHILDLGCGTGTLALLIQQTYGDSEVFGVDGDLNVLKIARDKVVSSGSPPFLAAGMGFELPYPANRFDRVFSTLMFHHLTYEAKQRTLQEALRVLKPGGQLCVADWGKPANRLMRILYFLVQLFDGFTTTTDNVKGVLPQLMRDAGFAEVREVNYVNTLFGTLRLTIALKPS